MIEGSCTDLATVYTVLKHAQMATDVLEQHDLYCHLHPSKTNSNEVLRRILEARGLSFRITHRTELYLSLVGKKCRFFVPALGNIFQYVTRSGRKFGNLKPCSFSNLQNWIFFHDRRLRYRFYRCVYSLEA